MSIELVGKEIIFISELLIQVEKLCLESVEKVPNQKRNIYFECEKYNEKLCFL